MTTETIINPKDLDGAKRELRKLPVKLTPDETTAKHKRAVGLIGEIDAALAEVEAEKERAKAAVKAKENRVAALRACATETARAAETGEEPRDVEVFFIVDRKARQRMTVRGDTLDIIERRAAYQDEIDEGCAWVEDMEKGVARFTHTASGFVVRERVLTAEERQLTIDAVAPRELVWISGATYANLDEDELEAITCPVPGGTRLKWEASGDWQFTAAPVGATRDGLLHQLARFNFPCKVGNDAPKTIGDLARRVDAAAAGGGKVTSIAKGKRGPKSEG